jgi:hypothetical protein
VKLLGGSVNLGTDHLTVPETFLGVICYTIGFCDGLRLLRSATVRKWNDSSNCAWIIFLISRSQSMLSLLSVCWPTLAHSTG